MEDQFAVAESEVAQMAEKLAMRTPEIRFHAGLVMPGEEAEQVVRNSFGIDELWVSRAFVESASLSDIRFRLAAALVRHDPRHRRRAALDHYVSLGVLIAGTLAVTLTLGMIWGPRWAPFSLVGPPLIGAYFVAKRESRMRRLMVLDAVEMTGEAEAALTDCRARAYVRSYDAVAPIKTIFRRGSRSLGTGSGAEKARLQV